MVSDLVTLRRGSLRIASVIAELFFIVVVGQFWTLAI